MKRVPIHGGHMQWIIDQSINSASDISLAEMTIYPGETSELHRHNNCTEIIYILSGTVRQRIDDRWIVLETGESCLIPIGSAHQTQNLGQMDSRMILAYSRGTRHYEAIK